MQPKIIKKDKLIITGLTGNGINTCEVWNSFSNRYENNPYPKLDESSYEIRFGSSRRTGRKPDPEKSVHVGVLTEKAPENCDYVSIELPASEYAVFDVFVAKGYNSGNEAMEKWIADNAVIYGLREFDGYEYIVECYNEKFKDGDKPDSIVEIWIPLFRFCQSCYMPMTKPGEFGTEADGSQSSDYCCHCYQNGDFTWKPSFEEFVEYNIGFWRDGRSSDEEARKKILGVFPKLKRWKK